MGRAAWSGAHCSSWKQVGAMNRTRRKVKAPQRKEAKTSLEEWKKMKSAQAKRTGPKAASRAKRGRADRRWSIAEAFDSRIGPWIDDEVVG